MKNAPEFSKITVGFEFLLNKTKTMEKTHTHTNRKSMLKKAKDGAVC